MRYDQIRRSDRAAAYALAGVSDPTPWLTHSREVPTVKIPISLCFIINHYCYDFGVIIRKYREVFTTYIIRDLYKLLVIVSSVVWGQSACAKPLQVVYRTEACLVSADFKPKVTLSRALKS